jgi:hypothetical protein
LVVKHEKNKCKKKKKKKKTETHHHHHQQHSDIIISQECRGVARPVMIRSRL